MMTRSIDELMDAYIECQADMRHVLMARVRGHFGVLVSDDPLARMYQRRQRFSRNLATMIRVQGAELEMLRAENARLVAELTRCRDYADDLTADDEAGMMLASVAGG
jgi:hypothetical protein